MGSPLVSQPVVTEPRRSSRRQPPRRWDVHAVAPTIRHTSPGLTVTTPWLEWLPELLVMLGLRIEDPRPPETRNVSSPMPFGVFGLRGPFRGPRGAFNSRSRVKESRRFQHGPARAPGTVKKRLGTKDSLAADDPKQLYAVVEAGA